MKTLVLQGFGISIKVENGKLVITQGKNRITGKQEAIEITDNTKFDKIIIEGNTGWISFHALDWLSYLGINVVMVDRKGRLYATFNQIKGDTEPTIRQQQYDCFRNEKSLDYLRKWIVTERINSQIQLLRERIMIDTIAEALSNIDWSYVTLSRLQSKTRIYQFDTAIRIGLSGLSLTKSIINLDFFGERRRNSTA